ncbi:hypothetical protein RHMOL_Rhmol10G0024200 [Rhododendron molle]|uniref:Uncharacterized protein n=1 Tax=Rhododendron molle TaxID=49168 RepID=A0ACC0LY85_RHOML|nr:hypothetical protein RHMOL_Rhmol10G0024200 [Rhododendron molle]
MADGYPPSSIGSQRMEHTSSAPSRLSRSSTHTMLKHHPSPLLYSHTESSFSSVEEPVLLRCGARSERLASAISVLDRFLLARFMVMLGQLVYFFSAFRFVVLPLVAILAIIALILLLYINLSNLELPIAIQIIVLAAGILTIMLLLPIYVFIIQSTQFVKVLKANIGGTLGRTYFITFQVKDRACSGSPILNFRAKVRTFKGQATVTFSAPEL